MAQFRVIATLRLRGSARRAWKPDPSRTVMSWGQYSNEIGTGGCLIHAFVQDAPPSVLFVQKASSFQGCFAESTRRAIRDGQGTRLHFGYYTGLAYTFHYNRQITWPFLGGMGKSWR
jgi:hypothetical protein